MRTTKDMRTVDQGAKQSISNLSISNCKCFKCFGLTCIFPVNSLLQSLNTNKQQSNWEKKNVVKTHRRR